jgi:hypothetical protein
VPVRVCLTGIGGRDNKRAQLSSPCSFNQVEITPATAFTFVSAIT